MVRKFRLYVISVFFIFFLTGCGGGGGGGSSPSGSTQPDNSTNSVTLSWDTPTTRTEGTPLPDLAGYNVYYGRSPQSYSQIIDAGNAKTYTIDNLPGGTYYFALTAYDSSGNETEISDEVKKTVP